MCRPTHPAAPKTNLSGKLLRLLTRRLWSGLAAALFALPLPSSSGLVSDFIPESPKFTNHQQRCAKAKGWLLEAAWPGLDPLWFWPLASISLMVQQQRSSAQKTDPGRCSELLAVIIVLSTCKLPITWGEFGEIVGPSLTLGLYVFYLAEICFHFCKFSQDGRETGVLVFRAVLFQLHEVLEWPLHSDSPILTPWR